MNKLQKYLGLQGNLHCKICYKQNQNLLQILKNEEQTEKKGGGSETQRKNSGVIERERKETGRDREMNRQGERGMREREMRIKQREMGGRKGEGKRNR